MKQDDKIRLVGVGECKRASGDCYTCVLNDSMHSLWDGE